MAAGAPKEGLLSASVASTSAPGSLSTAAATTATSGGAMDPPPRRSLLTRSFGELTMNGVRHSALTLTSTALGGGVLSVSYVMRLAGFGLGALMLVTGAALAFLGCSKLMWMTNETNQATYAALFSHCAGPRAGPVLDAMLFVYGNGSCVGYFVFLGDFIPQLIALAAGRSAGPAWWRDVAIFGSVLVLLPVVVQRDTSCFRFIAPVSIVALLYMGTVVAFKTPAEFSEHDGEPGYGRPHLVQSSVEGWLNAFALCIFAFNCHINVVPVAGQMVRPTKTRITKVSAQVNLLQLCFYMLIGVTGYMSFLEDTPQDILKGYKSTDPWCAGGRVLLSCTMLVAVVLNLNPTVRSGLQILDYFRPGSPPLMPSPAASPREGQLPRPAAAPEAPQQGDRARVLVTVACLVVQACIAVKVPGVADVLGLLGATVATCMMLVIPAICMDKVMEKTSKMRAQQAILLFFSAVAFASVPMKIYRIFHPAGP
mmetsp:Transcript_7461/g.19957  ORF Transcript_7461/g.19957 Transcript_7461/m.19957 type:complete len:482 (+) Transcript_7461:73-1518(+)